jgi:hypothetical protein
MLCLENGAVEEDDEEEDEEEEEEEEEEEDFVGSTFIEEQVMEDCCKARG